MTVTSLTDEQVEAMKAALAPSQLQGDNRLYVSGDRVGDRVQLPFKADSVRSALTELTDLRERLGSLTAETSALKDVAAERQRQIEAEGWTPEHDDQHRTGQMADAAARYAVAGGGTFPDERTAFLWPWAGSWWKPGNKRRSLVKAGALILAEIERLDRLAAKGGDK